MHIKNKKRTMKNLVNDSIDFVDENDKKDINKSLKIRIISGLLYLLVIIIKVFIIISNISLFISVFKISNVKVYTHLYYIFKTILMFIPATIGFITVLYEDNRVRKLLTKYIIITSCIEIIICSLDIFNVFLPMNYNVNPLLYILIDLIIIFISLYSLSIYNYDTYYPEYLNDIKEDIENLEIDYSIKDKSPKNRDQI